MEKFNEYENEVTPDEVTPDEVTPDEVTPDEVTPDEVTPDESFFNKVKTVSKDIVEEINNDPVMKWYVRGAAFIAAVTIGMGLQKRYGTTYKEDLEDVSLLTSRPMRDAIKGIQENGKRRNMERKIEKKELKDAVKKLRKL